MQKAKKFNTKEITRVTVRFYDGEFVNKLTSLYQKVGGTQSSFLGMLIREGYTKVASLYPEEDNKKPVSVSLGVQGDEVKKSLDDLKDLCLLKSDAEVKGLTSLSEGQKSLMKLTSCLYNLFLLAYLNDDTIKDFAEQGGFDKVPERFRKKA